MGRVQIKFMFYKLGALNGASQKNAHEKHEHRTLAKFTFCKSRALREVSQKNAHK